MGIPNRFNQIGSRSSDGKVENTANEFETAYFTWWLPLAIDADPVLRGFLHWDHESRIERFRELDEAVQKLAAEQVIRAVSHGLPARDGVPRKSELGTLRHQLGLQRPSVSIRDLIRAMPTTFSKLAPCVLMSPLSIAQYLPADRSAFDVVVFDEASQITTWDAVGAIARGRQSIIVGDPKQLPPTNFFGRADSEDEETPEYERDLPSILDEAAAAGLPTLQLNWHYRSRDEALIAFSNHHYYGDRLVTFPSPQTESEALHHHRIDGTYARGAGRHNEAEAKAVVALAVRRLTAALDEEETARPTLGVITFNVQQQELILDLLDAERRRDPRLEWFFEDPREEPVIVKNLENIQGDERDVMLFSVTFGPDLAGKLTMNFGALNGDGGEKRLNVAVTRARCELHVFASLDSDMIDLGRTKARGVADLKNFLAFAERGAEALPGRETGSMGPSESPFETAVAEALAAKGWEVRTQIGVSGFRIDLGVVHPDRAGAYLAGVECDGATYHRSASARDRDRIREGVLRSLGWEILRVWSTDWFMNRREALDRLSSALAALLEDDRARRAEADAAREAAAAEATARADEDDEPYTSGSTQSPIGVDATGQASVAAPNDGDDNAPSPWAESDAKTASMENEEHSDTPSPPKDEAEPVSAESDVLPKVASAAVGTCSGVNAEGGVARPVLDPDRFLDPEYDETLNQLIDAIVGDEGPIRLDMLARQVSRAHGWQRTGHRIRDRVSNALGANECHREGQETFVWAPGAHTDRLPFRAGTERSVREIPQAEILWLADRIDGLTGQADPALTLARQMGIARLSEDARRHLERCIEQQTD